MFLAALTSLSWWVPQYGHVQDRMFNGLHPVRLPHVEQVWLDGYQRSMTMSRRPYQSALYSSMVRNMLQEASRMLRFIPFLAYFPFCR